MPTSGPDNSNTLRFQLNFSHGFSVRKPLRALMVNVSSCVFHLPTLGSLGCLLVFSEYLLGAAGVFGQRVNCLGSLWILRQFFFLCARERDNCPFFFFLLEDIFSIFSPRNPPSRRVGISYRYFFFEITIRKLH